MSKLSLLKLDFFSLYLLVQNTKSKKKNRVYLDQLVDVQEALMKTRGGRSFLDKFESPRHY